MNISLVGDISLNDKYIELYKKGIDPFKELQPILTKSEFVIGNLECMAKGNKGENELKKPRLTTTVETLKYLKNISLDVACLAHNHVYDHLEDGFIRTIEFLKSNKIQFLGAGLSKDLASKPIILTKNKITIGLLNYVTRDTHPCIPDNASVYLNYFDPVIAVKEIHELKNNVDHLVILLHWGGKVEGGLYPDFDQPVIARELINAGADLVIGHHSHTFQPYEIYKGKYIFYSLGNFCFSDFEFEGKNYINPERRKITGIVNLQFTKSETLISTMFFKNIVNQYEFYPGYHRKLKFRNFIFRKILKYYIFWMIYFFGKKYLLPLSQFIFRRDISTKQKVKRIIDSLKRRV